MANFASPVPLIFGPYPSASDRQCRTVYSTPIDIPSGTRIRPAEGGEGDMPAAKRLRRSNGSSQIQTQLSAAQIEPPRDRHQNVDGYYSGPTSSASASTSTSTSTAASIDILPPPLIPKIRDTPTRSRPTSSSTRPSPSPSPQTKSQSIITVAPGKDAFETKYTPEDLFTMLKGTKFSGRLPSVGLKGPGLEAMDAQSIRGDVAGAEVKREGKGKGPASKVVKQDIWTDEAEYAFLAAELYVPPSSASKVMFLNKACGRNEIIGLVVTLALGKLMTRKQVSSHLQVVRQRKKMHPQLKVLFDQDDSKGNTTQGTPHLRGVSTRLNIIMGLDESCDLSTTPKPRWVTQLENKHPGPEFKNRRFSASVSGDSTAEDQTVTSGGSVSRADRMEGLNLDQSNGSSNSNKASGIEISGRARLNDARMSRAHAWLEKREDSGSESGDEEEDESDLDSEDDDDGIISSSGESSAVYPETSSSAGQAIGCHVRVAQPTSDERWSAGSSVSPSFPFSIPHTAVVHSINQKALQRPVIPARSCQLDSLYISIGSHTVIANIENIGKIKFHDIPTWDIRFGNELSAIYSRCTVLHAEIKVDPILLSSGDLRFDLEVSSQVPGAGPDQLRSVNHYNKIKDGAMINVTSMNGYLEAIPVRYPQERPISYSCSPSTTTKKGNIQIPCQETILPRLLAEQIDYERGVDERRGIQRAVDSVLPYYWTAQRISSLMDGGIADEGDCVIIYTYVAGSTGSLHVKMDRVAF